ncbi:MAG: ATP-dependent sacrificial sulfur transferase LarE, partial [candidate division WOR-3 bacterium]
TVDSPLYPKGELREAKKIARRLKVRHLIIHSDELKNQNFVKNKKTRCYYCKIELFRNLQKIAREYGYTVVEASNKTDLKDFRPGLLAAKKMGVDSPLIKAGLLKEEIRMLARKFGLPNWNKPSMACLASRIPYGRRIKREVLTRISKAEDYLKRFKITQVRVRAHLPIARLEVLPHEFRMILENKTQIIRYLKKLGYRYITLDLEGYKSGSMNL